MSGAGRGEEEEGRIRQRDIDVSLVVKYEGSCSSLVLAELRNDCLCDNCVTFVLARRQHVSV